MRILLLLLPNLYDFFTLILIGYAFFLNGNSQLKIPFGLACLFIYITTRVGIFAGKIVHLMFDRPNPEEENMEIPAELAAKKMITGIIPQCVFIVICQVILALFFLQNPAFAKMTSPDKVTKPQEQQVQTDDKSVEEAQNADDTLSADPAKANLSEEDEEDEEIVPAVPKKVTNTGAGYKRYSGYNTRNISVAKKPAAKTNAQVVTSAKSNVYYEIPDRTLKSAGTTSAERRATYAGAQTLAPNIPVATSNSANWSFSGASNSNYNVRVAQNTQTVQSEKYSTAKPKRYPGDDNPVNVHWGYYRYAESVPGGTQVQNTTPANNDRRNYNNIPQNTLRSIEY